MNTLGIGGGRPRTRPDGDTVKELKCSKCLKVLPKDAFPWRGLQRGYASGLDYGPEVAQGALRQGRRSLERAGEGGRGVVPGIL